MKRLVLAFLVFALLGFAATALAQTVNNPTRAEFTASADHAQVSSYELGWFLVGATDPVSTVDIGKPTPDPVTNLCAVTINVMPLGFNTYVAKARAKAGTVYSDWSPASNTFQRIPGPPSKPIIK